MIVNGKHMCMHCKEKPTDSFLDWKGSGFFCSKICREIWNDKHPDETVFRDIAIISEKKYCEKCNHIMQERITPEEGSVWYCRKCERKK